VLPSAQGAQLPKHIGYAEGACFGISALTALQAVHLAKISPASTVMIVGGGGSVAHYAIQFAKMRGARVITTVSGLEKEVHARRTGADEVINYRTENVGQRVKTLRSEIRLISGATCLTL
jgi:NADPH:quinone reductase